MPGIQKEDEMKKALFLLLLSLLLLIGGYACSNEKDKSEESTLSVEEDVLREIVDINGNIVQVPSPNKINRVVIISPPISSIYYSAIKDTSNIIAINPLTFKNANYEIMKRIFTNLNDVDSSFVKGFNVNVEALLNLKPDIIFYYGLQQKKGLENLNIPMVDFMKQNDRNPVTITIEWERVIRDIFNIREGVKIEDEWQKTQQVTEHLAQLNEEQLKGLMIFNNSSNRIVVSGNHSYGDYWLKMSGLINVADDVEGEKEVSMEQIYEWNPDIIYVFMGESASNYTEGIKGQDWSKVNAVKEKCVYDVPKGIYSWATPNSDSPLMVHWMAYKNYPLLFKKNEINHMIKDYYLNHYNMTLSDDMLNSILNPNIESE